MNWILALVGPMLIRMVSSTLLKAIAKETISVVIDRIEVRLINAGYPDAAKMLDKIQHELLDEVESAPVQPSGPVNPNGGGGLLSRIIDRIKNNPPADRR